MLAFEVCVVRKGIATTTLADIANEAGLPRSLVRYFMGNRDDMIDRLIERMMSRAEASLARIRDESGAMSLDDLLDAMFNEVFANELSNDVMGELWHLAKSDAHVRERLRNVYEYALDLLVKALARARIGSAKARRNAAFAILSLALGESSLVDFGIRPNDRRAMRRAAARLVAQLNEGVDA